MSHRTDDDIASAFRLERELAEEAARTAGAYLRSQVGHVIVTRKKDVHDDQLDADLEAERIILTHLRKFFPDDSYLSEEGGSDKGDSDRKWIVDPLDGSANFQHGNPMFGVAICLTVANESVVGVIYLPQLEEMYSAIRGAGAVMNGTRIKVSDMDRLGDAIIHVGDFATTGRPEDNQERIAILARLANEAGRVRMLGSAAADFAFVACGRADGLIMSNAHPWDIEAGRLLVSEGGGDVSNSHLTAWRSLGIYGNGVIQGALSRLVNESGASRGWTHGSP